MAGELSARPVLDTVRRAGLAIGRRPDRYAGAPSPSPTPLVLLPPLATGAPARFAIFDVTDRAELVRQGATTCVATVLAGRMVFRAR